MPTMMLYLLLIFLTGALSAPQEEVPKDPEGGEGEEKVLHSGRVIRQIVFPEEHGRFGGLHGFGRGFPGPGESFPGHVPSFPGQEGRFPEPFGGVPAHNAGFPVQTGGFPGHFGGFPPHPRSFPDHGIDPAFNFSDTCNCATLVTCAAEVGQISRSCVLPNGVPGVCCPPPLLASFPPPIGTEDDRILHQARKNIKLHPLDFTLVNQACQKGLEDASDIREMEQVLLDNNLILSPDSPAYSHLRVFSVKPRFKRQDQDALAIALATQNIVNDLSLTPDEGAHGLRNVQVANTILGDRCPLPPVCNIPNSKYRTADGSCNNMKHPDWGMSGSPMQRILPPFYDDGVLAPKQRGVNGDPLPNERLVSSSVLLDADIPDQEFTSSVMQWAQLIDHDLTHIPFPSLENGEGIECCPNGQEAPPNLRHPKCFPITILEDEFYTPRAQSCMNFVRSMLAVGPGTDCTFGYAEQMNQLTHWLDGSMVYGSDFEQQTALRTLSDGLMKTTGNNLLPISPKQGGTCEARSRGALCYLAGDSRVNEQPGLTAIHIIFVREHNRIARELQFMNPTWSDEAIYQETRRIVVAEIQHITYNEWLPIIVGPKFMQSFGISTRASGYSFDYNPNFNPNMNNEFSTAAFRFGHTLVQGNLRLFSPTGEISSILLRDHFNSPHLIQQNPHVLDMIIRSYTQLAIQKFDSFITQDLTNHLFQTPRFNFGMDLMSLNLHRARDHGLATYNDMRQVCGLPRALTFDDIKDQIPVPIVDRLAELYGHVDDIDFFVGGITERPVSGGLLGWTFLCVVGDQFARLKKGDRYFYDVGGQPGSFTEPQLQEIRRSSWARLLCDTADNLEVVQPLAFQQANNLFNRPVPCDSPQIPRPNLEFWRGEPPAA